MAAHRSPLAAPREASEYRGALSACWPCVLSAPLLPAASPRDIHHGQREPRQNRTSAQDKAGSNEGSLSGRTWQQRKNEHRPPTASSDFPASLKRPGLSLQLSGPKRGPREAWLDPIETPDAPVWSAGEEPETGGHGSSSVSSGRLSGSSGGHECTLPPRVWKERPPQVMRPARRAQQSDPRLDRLRDKIRAQVAWQASCGSLGTTVPSSASHIYKGPRKVRKVAHISAVQTHPGSVQRASTQVGDKASTSQRCKPTKVSQRQASVPRENHKRTKSCSCKREKAPKSPTPQSTRKDKDSELVGVYAWRRGQALVRLLLGPHPQLPRPRRQVPSREPAPAEELGGSKAVPAAACDPAPVRKTSPACSEPQVSAKTPSMASLDQPATIQVAMAMLQDLRRQIQAGLDLAQHSPIGWSKTDRKDPTKLRQQDTQGVSDTMSAFSKRSRATPEGKISASERPCRLPGQQPFRASARMRSSPQRAWMAEAWEPSSQRPLSPGTRQGSFPPQSWSTSAGLSCEDPDTPIRGLRTKGRSPPPQRPWSSSSGLRDWAAPIRPQWHLLERPSRLAQQPSGRSFVQRTNGHADASGKEKSEEMPAGQRRPGLRSEPPRAIVRLKAQADKASAMHALELQGRRLRDDPYHQQREVVLGRPAPEVSQTRPGIVTSVQHSTRPEATQPLGSLGSPVQEWSKVTSGKVMRNQEAAGSFCLCLNKAFSHSKTPKTEASSRLLSANASPHPWELQDSPSRLCFYLDSEDAETVSLPLHFQYKQARLRALENMANVLKHRIDMLTKKLQRPETLDSLSVLAPDLPPPLLPSPEPTIPSLRALAWPQALVPSGEVSVLSSPLCPPDAEGLPWSSGQTQPESMRQDPSLLELRLTRTVGSSCPVSALSSSRVPITLDPYCSSLRLDKVQAARGASSGKLWTPLTFGGQGPEEPHLGHLQGDPLTHLQQKSLNFLETLKLEQWKQTMAMTLLRQRAEHEVMETKATLDTLLLRPQLQRQTETQARPGRTLELEGPQACGDPDTQSVSTGPTKEAEHPNIGPYQLPSPRLDPWEDKKMKKSPDQGFELQMLEQSLHEEELRAEHQAALLRLREKALVEKVEAELTELEHQRRCRGGRRDEAALAGLEERQQTILDNLQREQKELQYLRSLQLLAHRERKLLLQHQRDLASMQRCTARLQQELQGLSTLPQVSGPKTSPQPEGHPWTSSHLRTSGSSSGLHPPRSPQSSASTQLLDGQAGGTPPRTPLPVSSHLLPPRPDWGKDTAAGDWPDSRHQLLDTHTGQAPLTEPSPELMEEKAWMDELHSLGPGQPSLGEDGPFRPSAASVTEGSSSQVAPLGLDIVGIPMQVSSEMEDWRSEAQRTETCRLEDTGAPSAQTEATQLATFQGTGIPEKKAPPESSPLPGLAAPLDKDPASAPDTCSGLSSAGSSSSLSCSSLQEFQKASAVLVHVSDSSPSLPDLDPEDTSDTELSWARGLSISASQEALGHTSEPQAWPTWRPHPDEPWTSGTPGALAVEGIRPGLWCGKSPQAAREGSPEPAAEWLGSGSELSGASSLIWGEESEDISGCSPGTEPPSVCPSPAEGLYGPEHEGEACTMPSSSCAGDFQEVSRAGLSLIIGSSQDGTQQKPSLATHTGSPPQTSPLSDLDLSHSLSLGESALEDIDVSNIDEAGPLLALAGCPQGPLDTAEAPSRAGHPKSCAASLRGIKDPADPEEVGEVLTELLSPVDEMLSSSSADLPSSTCRDASLPPPPSQPDPAGSVYSGDFPSPPEEALCRGASPGSLEEDTFTSVDELPSWPEESVSLAPQGAGCPRDGGSDHSLEGRGEERSEAENQAGSDQGSLRRGPADAPEGLLQLFPQPSPPSFLAGESKLLGDGEEEQGRHHASDPPQRWGAPTVDVASWTGIALKVPSGSQGAPRGGALCSEYAEGEGRSGSPWMGLGEHLDTLSKASMVDSDSGDMSGEGIRAANPSAQAPLVAGSQAGRHGYTGEEAEGGLGCQVEGRLEARDAVSGELLLGRDVDRVPSAGSGPGSDEVVDVVSAQLTQRILHDSLAALSELAQQGSLRVEEPPQGADRLSPVSPKLPEQLLGSLGDA